VYVFERAFSECASKTVKELADVYGLEADREEVAEFIGKRWASQVDQPGARRLERTGRRACLQAFDEQQ
jgi:hypothetical protein